MTPITAPGSPVDVQLGVHPPGRDDDERIGRAIVLYPFYLDLEPASAVEDELMIVYDPACFEKIGRNITIGGV